MKEIWKIISGWPYQASSLGRIRRVPGIKHNKCGNRFLRPHKKPKGYYKVDLKDRPKRQTHTVHSLVAKAFLGPRPEGYHINHKNFLILDNRASNLEYLTPKQNNHYSRRAGRYPCGKKNILAFPTEDSKEKKS